MNWYKQSQQNNIVTKMVSVIGMATILSLLVLKGMTMPDLAEEYQTNPQQVIQEAKQVEEQQTPPKYIEQTQPPQMEQPPVQKDMGPIDLDKIWAIESSRGKDPNMGKSSAGARGHYQFMKNTWNEMVGKMGVDWDWWNGSMDYKKSTQVADFYLNIEIPRLLKSFGIPDTTETRIGAYSWGIGHLSRKGWERYGEDWLKYSPKDTIDYVTKYKGV